MFRNNIFTIILFGSLCASITTASAEMIFSDSFESGDLTATSADGFKWSSPNKTSVVTQDAADGSVKLYDGEGATYEVLSDLMPDGTDREYTAKDDNKSLRFKYDAYDSGVKEPQWTEQRFELGKGYPDIWLSYHVRVPLNYSRGLDGPSPGRNNKWALIGMGNTAMLYAKDDPIGNPDQDRHSSMVVFNDWPNATQDGINFEFQLRSIYNFKTIYTNSPIYKDFIVPADAGRWMEFIVHFKASSSTGAANGSVNVYRKWDDERSFEYITGLSDVVIDISDEAIANGYSGWGGGYLFGYANDWYEEEVDWLVDDITLSNTALLPNPPLPPNKVTQIK